MKTKLILTIISVIASTQICLAQSSGNSPASEAYNDLEKRMDLQVNCLEGEVSGHKDLATPWPLQMHSERHTQIQKAISNNIRNVQYCFERFGELTEPIKFLIPASGQIAVDSSTVNSPAAECISYMLNNTRVLSYLCDMNVPYEWSGNFPLLNQERKEFP